jgi:hypothetical protein
MPLFKRLQATKLLTGEACSLVSHVRGVVQTGYVLAAKNQYLDGGRTDIESTVTPRLGAADVNLRL